MCEFSKLKKQNFADLNLKEFADEKCLESDAHEVNVLLSATLIAELATAFKAYREYTISNTPFGKILPGKIQKVDVE